MRKWDLQCLVKTKQKWVILSVEASLLPGAVTHIGKLGQGFDKVGILSTSHSYSLTSLRVWSSNFELSILKRFSLLSCISDSYVYDKKGTLNLLKRLTRWQGGSPLLVHTVWHGGLEISTYLEKVLPFSLYFSFIQREGHFELFKLLKCQCNSGVHSIWNAWNGTLAHVSAHTNMTYLFTHKHVCKYTMYIIHVYRILYPCATCVRITFTASCLVVKTVKDKQCMLHSLSAWDAPGWADFNVHMRVSRF